MNEPVLHAAANPRPANEVGCAPADTLSLSEALGVRRGDVVALVGGGGKTSALFRLAKELAASGGRVLITTTTHIYAPPPGEYATVLAGNLDDLIAATRRALQTSATVVVGRAVQDDGRLIGIDPGWVGELRAQLPATNVLVEADGSKGRPLKAPASHEPVIPAEADLVVPVVGLSALGEPLSDKIAHRAERVAALASVPLGEVITPAVIAAVLLHPDGSTRGAPPRARIVPLFNQADNDERLAVARRLAGEVQARGVSRVVIAALGCAAIAEAQRVRELVGALPGARRAVAAVILAAGEARRMGAVKLALQINGRSLLRHVVDAALATDLDEVVVVLGRAAAELQRELPYDDGRVRAVYNPDYSSGQSSSLKAGLEAISVRAEAVMVLLADQPLPAEAMRAVLQAYGRGNAPLLQACYRGVAGHPVVFARRLFAELLALGGDQGGREVLARHADELCRVPLDMELPRDVDTVQDYEALARSFSGRPGIR